MQHTARCVQTQKPPTENSATTKHATPRAVLARPGCVWVGRESLPSLSAPDSGLTGLVTGMASSPSPAKRWDAADSALASSSSPTSSKDVVLLLVLEPGDCPAAGLSASSREAATMRSFRLLMKASSAAALLSSAGTQSNSMNKKPINPLQDTPLAMQVQPQCFLMSCHNTACAQHKRQDYRDEYQTV